MSKSFGTALLALSFVLVGCDAGQETESTVLAQAQGEQPILPSVEAETEAQSEQAEHAEVSPQGEAVESTAPAGEQPAEEILPEQNSEESEPEASL
ncbi:MAG: hypothetical protein R3305_10880 [Gammaproteobacteria bacterium]|nr:hypothetical protein [Gammaproteobacteria bacterium]